MRDLPPQEPPGAAPEVDEQGSTGEAPERLELTLRGKWASSHDLAHDLDGGNQASRLLRDLVDPKQQSGDLRGREDLREFPVWLLVLSLAAAVVAVALVLVK